MRGDTLTEQHVHGVAGLRKYNIGVPGVVFMLFCLVAAGAFGIEEMIPEAGPGMTLILLTIFPLIWALPLSNIVAEASSLLPTEGGIYVWVREAFGEFWGFQAGWWETISSYITNGVYVALVAGYVSQLIPMSDPALFALKVGMIAVFTIVNLMGLREVDKVSTVLSVTIMLAFGLVTVVGLLNWQSNPLMPITPPETNILDSIGGGLCICIWMYCGYECISNMAGEIKNPQVIPKGLLIAMPLVALSYVLPTLAGLASLPAGTWEMWSTESGFVGGSVGYASVLTMHLGEAWGYIFLLVAIVSQCAIFNTYLASGSRGLFVLADDHFCPRFFTKISKKCGVPYNGILSLSIVTFILAQGDFTTLVSMEVLFLLALYIILPLSLMKLRRKIPVAERKKRGLYMVPGGKFGFALSCTLVIGISIFAMLTNGTDYFAIGVIAIGTGPIAYVLLKRHYGGLSVNDPVRHPVNAKTGLAHGDIPRIGIFGIILGGGSFLAQFWLRWYEGDFGAWIEEDYMMFNAFIPEIQNMLCWVGLAILIIGLIITAIGYRKDRPDKECRGIEEPIGINREALADEIRQQ